MKALKAFGKWYAYLIAPFATAIRPFLRSFSLILSLLLDCAALFMIVHGVVPFGKTVENVIFFVLAILLPIAVLTIILYIATLQMDLRTPSIRHWAKLIPPIIPVISFVVFLIIEGKFGRGALQWERYFDANFFSIVCILLSGALSSFYVHLLSFAKSGRYDS